MTETKLDAANRAIKLLEKQLMAHALAENHPRWTVTGEIVLIGDIGRFGRPDDKSDRVEGRQVVEIDAEDAQVATVPLGEPASATWLEFSFSDCADLVGRSRLPKRD